MDSRGTVYFVMWKYCVVLDVYVTVKRPANYNWIVVLYMYHNDFKMYIVLLSFGGTLMCIFTFANSKTTCGP